MQQKTILFFPIETGLAHILRSLSVAEELKRRNHRIFFFLPRKKHALFKGTTVPLLNTRSVTNKESIEIINILQDPELIADLAKQELKIVRKYKPDAVVVDFRPSALIPPIALNIPTFLIVGSTALPYGFYLPKFFKAPDILFRMIITPIARFFIGIARNRYFLQPTYKAFQKFYPHAKLSDLIDRIQYLIVEERSYLSDEKKRSNVHYVGHMTWKGFRHHAPSWLNKISPDGRTIYVSFGGTGFDKIKLISIAKSLLTKGYRVIVSSGTIAEPHEFQKNENLFVAKFLPGKTIAEKVDLVICHGGYGTIIETIIAGKPFVSLPFNPDQLFHSYRLQELGLGICISNSIFQNFRAGFRLDWKGLQNMSSQIPVEKVMKAVQSIFANYETYKKRVVRYSKKLTINGDKKAADVIEKIM